MARVSQERRVDEVTGATEGIQGNPSTVESNPGSRELALLSGILRELRILNVHIGYMTGEVVNESDNLVE